MRLWQLRTPERGRTPRAIVIASGTQTTTGGGTWPMGAEPLEWAGSQARLGRSAESGLDEDEARSPCCRAHVTDGRQRTLATSRPAPETAPGQ